MGTLSYCCSIIIYRHYICRFFTKILIIMSISTNIYRPYVCDPLGPYISLVNKSVDLIIVEDLFLQESKVCIKLSSSIHQ